MTAPSRSLRSKEGSVTKSERRETDYDAVVIGGGPSGSLSALLLQRLGWRTMVVDRRGPGVGKTCGHCLSPRVRPLLADLGLLADIERLAVGRTRTLRLHIAHGRVVTRALDGRHGPGLVVGRERLDELLLRRAAEAGATVCSSASARWNGETVCLRHDGHARDVRAGLVVGADGVGSHVARVMGGDATPRRGRKYGFSFGVDVDIGEPGTIDMFVIDGGYLGVVGAGGGRTHVAALVGDRASPAEVVRRVADEFPQLGPLVATDCPCHAIGPMPFRPRRVAGPGVALVGDAAGYVEPITGEGISQALESAAVLARVAAGETIGTWCVAAAARYRRTWRRVVRPRLRVCRCLAVLLEHPALLRRLTRQAVVG